MGLGKGKEDTPVWEGFFGSKWLSGVVVSVSRTCLAGWFGSWSLSSEINVVHTLVTFILYISLREQVVDFGQ